MIDVNKLNLVFSRLIVVVGSFVTVKLVTTYFSVEEVGAYYLILAYSSIIVLIYHSSISSYINRNIQKFDEQSTLISVLNVYFCNAIVFGFSVSLIFYVFFLLDDNIENSLLYILVIFIQSLALGTYNRFLYALNLLGEARLFALYSAGCSALSLILCVIAQFFCPSVILWLILPSSSMFIFSYISYAKLKKRYLISLKFNPDIRDIFKFSAPLILISFLMWWLNTGYRLVINNRFDVELLGYIAVALSIPIAIFSAVNTLLNQIYYPEFYKNIESDTLDAWYALSGKIFPILLITSVFIIGLSKSLLVILVGEKFHDLYLLVMLGAMVELFRYFSVSASLIAHIDNKTSLIVLPYVLGCCILTFFIFNADIQDELNIVTILLVSSIFVFLALVIKFKIRLFAIFNKHVILPVFYSGIFLFSLLFVFDSWYLNLINVLIFGLIYLFLVYLVCRIRT